jgi:hypothetical protein
MCGTAIWKGAALCRSCFNNLRTSVAKQQKQPKGTKTTRSKCNIGNRKVSNRPSPIELAKMIIETSFVGVGKQFGVSDSAIKKWCKNYEIPYTKQELVDWYNTQQNIEPLTNNRFKRVKQIDIKTGEIINVFQSICEAARKIGKPDSASHIIGACKGRNKTACGYKWEYV